MSTSTSPPNEREDTREPIAENGETVNAVVANEASVDRSQSDLSLVASIMGLDDETKRTIKKIIKYVSLLITIVSLIATILYQSTESVKTQKQLSELLAKLNNQ